MDKEKILQKLRELGLARNNQAVSEQARTGMTTTPPDNRVAEENRKRLELYSIERNNRRAMSLALKAQTELLLKNTRNTKPISSDMTSQLASQIEASRKADALVQEGHAADNQRFLNYFRY